jgi:branched-chain amino acid transport system ATP-binding protein
LTGFYKSTQGELLFHQENKTVPLHKILGEKFIFPDLIHPFNFSTKLYYKLWGGSHKITHQGIARTFQNIRLFKNMTVIENCLVAQHRFLNCHLIPGLLQTKKFLKSEQFAVKTAYQWLERLNLADEANQLAGNLAYGSQRRLEIARALCTRPRLLCLDEPAAGLNLSESQTLHEIILTLQQEDKISILLIEHDMELVMNLSDHIVVLDHGEVIATGSPESIKNNPAVLTAYLGIDDDG